MFLGRGRRGSRTLKAHRHPFSRRSPSPRWLALPDWLNAVGRTGIANRRCSHSCAVAKRPVPRSGTPSHEVGRTGIEPASYGLRDRCNPAFATDPLIPPLASRWEWGAGDTPLANCRVVREHECSFRTQESNPELAVQSRASFHWTSPDHGRRAQRFRSSDDALASDPQKRKGHRGLPRWPHLASALRAGQARGAAPPGNLPRLAHRCTPPASRAGRRLLSAFDEFSRMTCSRRMTRATLSDESNQYATARRLSIQNRDERFISDLDARQVSRFHRGEFFLAHAARRRRDSTWATSSSESASAETPPRDSGSPSAMASAVRSMR